MTLLLLAATACRDEGKLQKSGPQQAATESESSRIPAAGTIQHVPVGKFRAGSKPGEPGRDPALESPPTDVELGPFRIDAYPYPGDLEQAPRRGVTASEASALCAARNGRLCTELEWERACRGPDSAVYPSGAAPCTNQSDKSCLSGFDVSMQGSIPEWTKSVFGQGSDHEGKPVVRGAGVVSDSERRCSRRREQEAKEDVGFRCCYGAPNAAHLEEPTLGPAYKEVELSRDELTKLLREDPRSAMLATDVSLFKPEAARTVLARGPGETMGFQLTTQAVEWQPARGSRFLVVAGKSGKNTSFVVVYFVSPDTKSLAGSFIMKNEPGPVALGYADSIRPRIHFSSCWGCPGETGKVLFREPEELVLLQP